MVFVKVRELQFNNVPITDPPQPPLIKGGELSRGGMLFLIISLICVSPVNRIICDRSVEFLDWFADNP